jgi:hypothetical protein
MTFADELEALAKVLGHNWLLLVMGIIVFWLVITRLVESTEGLAKLLGPLGRKIVANYQKRRTSYHADVVAEAKMLALEIMPKIVPADYETVKTQLHNVIERIDDLEQENTAMRAFIVADEDWHFKWSLAVAQSGLADNITADLPVRVNWNEFLRSWRGGWRPGDFGISAQFPPAVP